MANFTPSINIGRDLGKGLHYIPTENAKQAYETIFRPAKGGIKSFCLIGSYGTGKSAFLLATIGALTGQNEYFPQHLPAYTPEEFLIIQGDHMSLIEGFAQSVASKSHKSKEVIKALDQKARGLEEKGKRLVIILDEFGKFLEHASQHQPEKELYFIQQVAELANDEDRSILFITTLHQQFDAYSNNMDRREMKEWEKVKGRLLEIPFNEPVEQLLVLASAYLGGNRDLFGQAPPQSLLQQAIKASKILGNKQTIAEEVAQQLYPLDTVSASIIAQSLQRYGQNERSLFTFLQSDVNYGIRRYDKEENPFFHAACVYDYLQENFYHLLATSHNPDYLQWSALRKALERAEGHLESHQQEACKLVKTVGLLNIFASAAAKLDIDFLCIYGEHALGIQDPKLVLSMLEDKQIIRFVQFKQSYILFEGSDVNIDVALKQAENKVVIPEDMVPLLNKHFQLPYIMAKRVQYQRGTPRIFRFLMEATPSDAVNQASTDGTVHLIFGSNPPEVKELSKSVNNAQVYGICQSTSQVRSFLLEIGKVEQVLAETLTDQVVQRELKTLKLHLTEQLLQVTVNSIYNGGFDWYFHGRKTTINSYRQFNSWLSQVCDTVYHHTPIFKNELMNKANLSGPIATARARFFEQLSDSLEKEDLGFPSKKFPPEKTIYLTLLKETGVHVYSEEADQYILQKPQAASFEAVWNCCEDFLKQAKARPRTVADLFQTLELPPYGLKQGFIHFWLPIYLFIRQEDFALYKDGIFVPSLNKQVVDMIYKNPEKFTIKAFDLEGVKLDIFNQYRTLVQQHSVEKPDVNSFVETIRPFLVFYQQLPKYTQQTKTGLSTEAQALREAIKQAKDPEKSFFEDFPEALSFRRLTEGSQEEIEKFTLTLQETIRELRSAYQELQDRFVNLLIRELGLPDNVDFMECKEALQKRYLSLEGKQLLRRQQVFLSQVRSPLDDRESWVNALAKSVCGQALNAIDDVQEMRLKELVSNILGELDNLVELADEDINNDAEDTYQLTLSSFNKEPIKEVLRLPKDKLDQQKLSKLKKLMTGDRRANMALVLAWLEEELASS